jgi:hypothetical protein
MSQPIKHLLTAAFITVAAGHAAVAGELPTYEAGSLPISPVQASVLGASAAGEQAPAAALSRAGMPATPLQITILSPHRRNAALATPVTVGAVRN